MLTDEELFRTDSGLLVNSVLIQLSLRDFGTEDLYSGRARLDRQIYIISEQLCDFSYLSTSPSLSSQIRSNICLGVIRALLGLSMGEKPSRKEEEESGRAEA